MPTATRNVSTYRLLLAVLAGLAMVTSCASDDGAAPAAATVASTSAADTDDTDTADTADTAADDGADESEDGETGSEAAAADDGTDSDYPPFQDIDPATSPFFAALEDTDLAERLGEQEIYERAVTICRDFDNGTTVDAEIDRLLGAGFGEDTPLLMAAAVTAICPQHVDTTTG